ncbi:MAG: sigma-70 family RNA polymerase sigma factor [Cytophagaceae bacterium]|nr:sigma-70 family RNA polymerase sigma factor [Cytophagaceae bacterium]
MDAESLANQELWNAFRQGEDVAFEALYRKFHPTLLRYGRKLVHDDAFIRDCIHDLFLHLHGHRATLRAFEPDPSADPVNYYLLASLRNLVVKRLTQQQRADLNDEEFTREQEGLVMSTEEALIIEEFSSKQLRQLRQALDQLPQRQREALHLRYFENRSVEQIAVLMEMNYQSACNVLHRAVKNLTRLIGVYAAIHPFLFGSVFPFPTFFLK